MKIKLKVKMPRARLNKTPRASVMRDRRQRRQGTRAARFRKAVAE